jgi:hypothetical protein
MAIAPDSASYPILGAARAAGEDYDIALNLVWRRRLWLRGEIELTKDGSDSPIYAEGVRRHGERAMDRLVGLLMAAVRDGRIYFPEAR